jgi:hypothetical protein
LSTNEWDSKTKMGDEGKERRERRRVGFQLREDEGGINE